MPDYDPHSESSASSEGWMDTNSADDEEPQTVISLLDDRVFADVASMLAHCRDAHGFDFVAVRDRLGLDFYGTVKLINYIRQRVHQGQHVSADISADDISSDAYLKPVLDNDALIFGLDSLPSPAPSHDPTAVSSSSPSALSGADQIAAMQQQNTVLQAELDSLTKQFDNYRLAVQETLDQRWGVDEPEGSAASKDAKVAKDEKTAPKTSSDYYFESYSYNDIHETMLKDTVRTDAYRDFVYNNKHLFAGKTVLDIGCGTGILSMFCAKAGAKRVIAVDRSAIINKARENIFNNGLQDQITCLQGLIEEVELPVDSVDIIISEWMGYALLYEAMLPSVLYARDKYLAPDGLLVPSHASLWVAPVCDPEYIADSITFWRDVYGFDMAAMQAGIYDDARAVVQPAATICGSPCMFRMLDLHTVRTADLVFDAPWQTSLTAAADSLDGFLVWFDIYFAAARGAAIEPVDATALAWAAADPQRTAFTTGPFSRDTHWKQCLLVLKAHSKVLAEPEGRHLAGSITFATALDNPRALTLRMTWGETAADLNKQSWALN